MSEAHGILAAAAASRKGGLRLTAQPSRLATLFNAMRRERQRFPATFGHLVFKRRRDHVDILNGNNILDALEEIFE